MVNFIKFIDFIINSKYNNNNRKWRNHKRGLPGCYVKTHRPVKTDVFFIVYLLLLIIITSAIIKAKAMIVTPINE